MTSRILPFAEWHKLDGTEVAEARSSLDPARTAILVVEDGETIVGCHVLMWILHAECLWIHPDHRGKASVGRRLWAAVQRTARAAGVPSLWTAACDDRVRGLLAHVGATELPGAHFVLPVKGDPCRP